MLIIGQQAMRVIGLGQYTRDRMHAIIEEDRYYCQMEWYEDIGAQIIHTDTGFKVYGKKTDYYMDITHKGDAYYKLMEDRKLLGSSIHHANAYLLFAINMANIDFIPAGSEREIAIMEINALREYGANYIVGGLQEFYDSRVAELKEGYGK